MVSEAMKLKDAFSWKKSYDQPAAASAKSLQSCPTLCDPIDSRLPGSSVPGILQARTLEWVNIIQKSLYDVTGAICLPKRQKHMTRKCDFLLFLFDID